MEPSRSRKRLLEWLVYALFSKDSTSSVSRVDISRHTVRSEDAELITRVLGAKNSSNTLLDTAGEDETREDNESDADRDLGFVDVKARELITVKPLSAADEGTESFALQQDGHFLVTRDSGDDNSIDIVVPCCGHCIIARDAIDCTHLA